MNLNIKGFRDSRREYEIPLRAWPCLSLRYILLALFLNALAVWKHMQAIEYIYFNGLIVAFFLFFSVRIRVIYHDLEKLSRSWGRECVLNHKGVTIFSKERKTLKFIPWDAAVGIRHSNKALTIQGAFYRHVIFFSEELSQEEDKALTRLGKSCSERSSRKKKEVDLPESFSRLYDLALAGVCIAFSTLITWLLYRGCFSFAPYGLINAMFLAIPVTHAAYFLFSSLNPRGIKAEYCSLGNKYVSVRLKDGTLYRVGRSLVSLRRVGFRRLLLRITGITDFILAQKKAKPLEALPPKRLLLTWLRFLFNFIVKTTIVLAVLYWSLIIFGGRLFQF